MMWRVVASASLAAFFVAASAHAQCKTCNGEGEVVCKSCNGEFRSVAREIECERKGGVGCGGRGFRDCFACNGSATKSCANCAGKGQVRIKKWRKNGAIRQPVFTRRRCAVCNGSGSIDCQKCHTLWVQLEPKQGQPPKFSHRPPFGRTPVTVNRFGATAENRHGTWTQHVGKIVCRRCNGTGKRTEKRLCQECRGRRGRVPCPDCDGPSAVAQDRLVPDPPMSLTRLHELQVAVAQLPITERERIRVALTEYLRLRQVMARIVKQSGKNAASTAAETIRKSDQAMREVEGTEK